MPTTHLPRIALAVGAAIVLVGCVSHRPIRGRDLSTESVREIVVHRTTDEEVLDIFGQPESILEYPDGTQEFRYSYTGWVDRRVNVLIRDRTHTEKEFKRLSIRFRDGVVAQVTYTNTADPSENISR